MKAIKFLTFFTFFICMLCVYSCKEDLSIEPSPNEESQLSQLANSRSSYDLCFMTWNAALGLGTDGAYTDDESAIVMCNQILAQDPTAVTIQEAWDGDAAEILKECLESNGYCVSYDPGVFAGIGGTLSAFNADGLMTAVKREFAGGSCGEMEDNSTFVEFKCENGIINNDNDALADKGFFVTEIQMEDGCSMSLINTHLDAGGSEGDQCARVCQIMQIREFMDDNNCGVTLMGGDFNINALSDTPIDEDCIERFNLAEGDSEFEILTQLFDGDPTIIHSQSPPLRPTSLGGGGLIDFHMISNFDRSFINITSVTNVDMECLDYFLVRWRGGFPFYRNYSKIFTSLADARAFVQNEEDDGTITGPFNVCSREEDVSDHTPVETCLNYDCDAEPDTEVLECFCEINLGPLGHRWQIDCENECPFWAQRIEEAKDCF